MNSPAVLVVVDVQNGFLDEYWGNSNNPDCESNIRALLAHWRERDWPIVLVQHNSESPRSPLRPGQPGNDLQPGIEGAHDLLVTKSVNSAFYGEPDLHAWLIAHKHTALVLCGITTNFCCETTARMAGNLGYTVEFVLDATRTFDHPDADGVMISADEIARVTAANLNGEFAAIVTTKQILGNSA